MSTASKTVRVFTICFGGGILGAAMVGGMYGNVLKVFVVAALLSALLTALVMWMQHMMGDAL